MDNSFTSPAVVIGGVGQQKFIENAGAKRILGTELLTKGKIPQFIYYLVNISSICFYANDGTNTWIGGFGHPVAGSLAVRDSLTPFQGQKFYLIDTDISYTYQGGAWEGGVIAANVMAPTFLILDYGDILTRGRSQVITVGEQFFLPAAVSTEDGDTLEGHAMEFVVQHGVIGATLAAVNAEQFQTNSSLLQTSLDLEGGTYYRAVFHNGMWEVFYRNVSTYLQSDFNLSDLSDKVQARTNLGVYGTAEVDSIADSKMNKAVNVGVGAGIKKTGVLATGDLVVSADFATNAEAINPANTTKVVNPSHLPLAVSEATRASQFNNITGLLPRTTEAKFLLTTVVGDRTKVQYPEFSAVFNPAPYVRDVPLQILTVPAGQIQIPYVAGPKVHYVKVTSFGVVSLQSTKVLGSSVNECHLGTLVTVNGEIYASAGLDVILNTPWLASTDYALRHGGTTLAGGVFTASPTVGKLQVDSYTITSEGANWEVSTVVPHSRVISSIDPVSWTYVDSVGTPTLPNPTDLVNGQYLASGVVVGANKYSIQCAYVTTEGAIVVLLGQVTFDTITAAIAQVLSYLPTLPPSLTTAVELARWVVKGNQYIGSPSIDLTNPDHFQSAAGSGVSGSSIGANASDITSSNVNNSLASTNLQEQVDELSDRTDWKLKAVAGAIAVTERNVMAAIGGAYTLPPVPAVGISQKLVAINGVVPVFTVNNPLTELITPALPDKFVSDTQFTILDVDSGVVFELISDGTNWVL